MPDPLDLAAIRADCNRPWTDEDDAIRFADTARATTIPRFLDVIEAMNKALKAVVNLGWNYRMDWSDFDGRVLKRQLEAICDPALALVKGGKDG